MIVPVLKVLILVYWWNYRVIYIYIYNHYRLIPFLWVSNGINIIYNLCIFMVYNINYNNFLFFNKLFGQSIHPSYFTRNLVMYYYNFKTYNYYLLKVKKNELNERLKVHWIMIWISVFSIFNTEKFYFQVLKILKTFLKITTKHAFKLFPRYLKSTKNMLGFFIVLNWTELKPI